MSASLTDGSLKLNFKYMSQEGVPKNKEQIIQELGQLKSRFYKNEELYERLVEFGEGLKEKYSDFLDYELFHFLVGSTMQGEPKHFDFPGEDSVEAFLRGQE